jgi:hypothetical protein
VKSLYLSDSHLHSYFFVNRALYQNSNISTFDASLYIFGFMHRFHLSEFARSQLLEMVHFLLPIGNKLPNTINKLSSKIGLEKVVVREKKYCPRCKQLFHLFDK